MTTNNAASPVQEKGWTSLVERLEAAEVGSRSLDRELAKLIDRAEWEKCANWASMPCGASSDVIDRDALRWLPKYTTSLDAALSLAERVLPGWTWALNSEREPLAYTDDGRPSASFASVVNDRPVLSVAVATTPALAVCAALTKAGAPE